ncbi:Ldh family oxidoreductase [Candidatus Entotheonella palauensis]|uniref:Ldh family oxidoreductase n=1 Tax=Candidatus Entotheonella palauensis TaxID=93172 RepID=UPI000B7CD882|nr:Ldh family oxidoreductase [Candidatus Entotheonella palauensis]
MPSLSPELLHDTGKAIFQAAGASDEEAQIVMEHLVGANLAGHDSHGVILIPSYINRIKRGHIVPGAPLEIERESPTTAHLNGNWGFGYVVTTRAMEMAIAKAKEHNVAAITIHLQGHVGRLADYPLMAAKAGMIGMITCDSGRASKSVVPFGGRVARLGTNPISVAFPSDLQGPIFLDMATSAVAAGKIGVKRNRGEPAPPGWILDKDGNDTTNVNDFYDGGAILPMGGDQGHKGYVLSFMVETLSGILTSLGFGIDPQGRHNDGTFISVFNVNAFRPLDEFKRDMEAFVRYIKDTPPAAGFTEVLYPGELEHRTAQERWRDGIFVEDETWNQLMALKAEYGLPTS